MSKQRINNTRFSIRFCRVAEDFGLITVGQMKVFLLKAKPNVRVGCGSSMIRLSKLRKELSGYLQVNFL